MAACEELLDEALTSITDNRRDKPIEQDQVENIHHSTPLVAGTIRASLIRETNGHANKELNTLPA